MFFTKEWLKQKFRILKIQFLNFIWRLFLCFLFVVGVPVACCYYIPFQNFCIPISISIILLIAVAYYIVKKTRTDNLYRLPSGVFYLYWAICLLPIEFYLLEFYTASPYRDFKVSDKDLLIGCSIVCIGAILNFLIPKVKIKRFDYFSPGAVGIDCDEYDMVESAKNNAKSFLNLNKHVSVVALDADTGYGKSSFVRMMIESLSPEDILYTYISLTETNNSTDFSHLFTERWSETLNKRYPRLFDSPEFHLELLSDILRENKQYFLISILLKWLQGIDFPLFRTRSKVSDTYSTPDSYDIVSKKVGRMFGGVPEIKEKIWIIVIDDFERSPIDEIYRVIEIIERFKIEGRNGMPVKLIFLLCFAGTNLKNLLYVEEKNKRTDLAFLVDQFLLSDKTKSIDKTISLPPVPTEVLKKGIIKKANNFLA